MAKMARNEFYSVITRKRIIIPDSRIREVVRSGRRFLVGTFKHEGKDREAWKIVGKKKK